MDIVYSAAHREHRGEFEMHRGQRVPCFETPERADRVLEALLCHGVGPMRAPDAFGRGPIERIHAADYLRFLEGAWVAILDVDYHHGNGTQQIFESRDDVLFASLHGDPRTEYPYYLGHADERGRGAGEGFTLNLPLPAGTGPAAWFAALETALARIAAYAPDAVVLSAFDAAAA